MTTVASDQTALTTYYGKPVLKEPVWIWSVPVYFYAGGAAGAALALGSVIQVRGDEELRPLVNACRWTGMTGIIAGSILLIVDLGRPERFHHMLRVLNPKSPLSIGSWILAAGGSTAGAAIALPRRLGDLAGLAAGIVGIPLAGYTGVLLCNSAIPVWKSAQRSLPALFVASAVASCAAIFECINLSPKAERLVRNFGLIGKSAELLCMKAVESELDLTPPTLGSLRNGLSGALWTASKVMTAVSLLATILPGGSKMRRSAGVVGTLAGLGLRFAVYYAGITSSRNPKAAL